MPCREDGSWGACVVLSSGGKKAGSRQASGRISDLETRSAVASRDLERVVRVVVLDPSKPSGTPGACRFEFSSSFCVIPALAILLVVMVVSTQVPEYPNLSHSWIAKCSFEVIKRSAVSMNRKANWIWVVHPSANSALTAASRPTRPATLFSRKILVLLIRWCCRHARQDNLVGPLPTLMLMSSSLHFVSVVPG
ncbi:hypothetical protein B0H14DRAFT_53850 [Mycena olivaceomarginata]|nr:hypothetical protein B0H14DRAFT_53850 [Mycena olivaceomarginata]